MITLVCGPPCVGKNTYISEHAGPADLVIDHDAIAQDLGSPRTHNHHGEYAKAAEARVQDLIANLEPNRPTWVIRSVPSAERRIALADQIGARSIVILIKDRDILVERAQSRPNPAATVRVIDWWLNVFTEDDDVRSTTERGYGSAHRRERKKWEPIVAAGQAACHAQTCFHDTRSIDPDEPWDLGHTQDRSGWTGPEHRYCNRKEPQLRAQRPTEPRRRAL